MTGFITVMESCLSVKDNQHVKYGLVVITCFFFSPHSLLIQEPLWGTRLPRAV